jgi:hypothetical protein
VLIAVGGEQASAAVKHYCCYRLDVEASWEIHASWDNAGEPGGSNGTYDMTSNWGVRELVEYTQSQFGTGAVKQLEWIRNRKDNPIKASWSRFSGSEKSNQSRNDSAGQPVPYPTCDFNYGVPWRRTNDASVIPSVRLTGGPGDFRGLTTHEQTDAYGPFWIDRQDGGCNNNVPFYSPDGGFQLSTEMGRYVTDWDAFGFGQIHRLHTNPPFNPGKLKKLKDYAVTFASTAVLANDTNDSRFDHTGTAPVSVTVKFTHFHRDRLQKEINRGDALK